VSASVTRNPAERYEQRRRVVHEVERVIEPAAWIGRRPTVGLACISVTRTPAEAVPGALPFGDASCGIASSPSRYRCRPSPCAGSPGSEYYGGSAPSRADRRSTRPTQPMRRMRGSG
jgi:hypothetical protein